jgi:uroporphyrinogen III methyltransferase/synthase
MAHTVIITRPRGPYAGDEGLSKRLVAEGFSPVLLSSLSVESRELTGGELDDIRATISSPGAWIAFLSPTAVHVMRDLCVKIGCDLPASSVRIAAQGAGTSEAVRNVCNREVDLESSICTAEVFAEQLALRLGGKGRVLVPQSAEGRDVFGPILRETGIEVQCISTYGLVTVAPTQEEVEAVRACPPEDSFIVFMSPSAVRATVENFPDPEHLKCLRVISVGPSTSKAIREAGLKVFAEAKEHSERGVVECLRGV